MPERNHTAYVPDLVDLQMSIQFKGTDIERLQDWKHLQIGKATNTYGITFFACEDVASISTGGEEALETIQAVLMISKPITGPWLIDGTFIRSNLRGKHLASHMYNLAMDLEGKLCSGWSLTHSGEKMWKMFTSKPDQYRVTAKFDDDSQHLLILKDDVIFDTVTLDEVEYNMHCLFVVQRL